MEIHELRNYILEDFEYREGHLFWKKRKRGVKLGNRVGNLDKYGYLHMSYRGKMLFLHRMIFLMHHGYLPKSLDHIDANRSNNKIENLREASHFQNMQNIRISKRNKTGVKGVCWRKREQRYFAICNVNGKQYELGSFKLLDEAAKAVKEFREKNHGEFARHV